MENNYYAEFTIDIILEVIFIATLITIFFFTYASYIEGLVVQNQVDFIVEDATSDLVIFPEIYRCALKSYMGETKSEGKTKADIAVEEHNAALLMKSAKVIGVGLLISMIIVALIAWKFNVHMTEIAIKVFIILIFVGLTEFAFLTYLGRYYKSGDPNFVKKTVVEVLRDVKPRRKY